MEKRIGSLGTPESLTANRLGSIAGSGLNSNSARFDPDLVAGPKDCVRLLPSTPTVAKDSDLLPPVQSEDRTA